MKPPQTYAEWSAVLVQFAASEEGDREALAAMEMGRMEWGAGVAERLAQLLADAFNARLKRTHLLLQRDLNAARGDELAVVRATLAARRRLQTLHRLASLPTFLDDVRAHWQAELKKFAERTQSSLEDSAITGDRSGRLRQAFRNNALTDYAGVPPALAPSEPAAPPLRGRRVIFQSHA